MTRHTITLKAPHLHPPNLISGKRRWWRVGGVVKEKRERRCNYHEHSLRDQLHFKEARAPRPMLQTAPSTSVVRVGKHEQITRLLIAARSEEVSTLCLPARLETLRQALAWKEQTRHARSAIWCSCVCVCVCASS